MRLARACKPAQKSGDQFHLMKSRHILGGCRTCAGADSAGARDRCSLAGAKPMATGLRTPSKVCTGRKGMGASSCESVEAAMVLRVLSTFAASEGIIQPRVQKRHVCVWDCPVTACQTRKGTLKGYGPRYSMCPFFFRFSSTARKATTSEPAKRSNASLQLIVGSFCNGNFFWCVLFVCSHFSFFSFSFLFGAISMVKDVDASSSGAGIGGKIKDMYEDEKRRIAEKVPPMPPTKPCFL